MTERRTQSGVRVKVSAERETMHWCPFPGCEGGQIREEKETATTYSVTLTDCTLCEGTGLVSKWKAAEYRERTGT